jgi:hypothetical protein
MKRYLKDFSSGATGSITIKADGSALLSVSAGGKRIVRKLYKNERSAMSAWYRLNA